MEIHRKPIQHAPSPGTPSNVQLGTIRIRAEAEAALTLRTSQRTERFHEDNTIEEGHGIANVIQLIAKLDAAIFNRSTIWIADLSPSTQA